jgi:hypothetical protein
MSRPAPVHNPERLLARRNASQTGSDTEEGISMGDCTLNIARIVVTRGEDWK